MATFSERPPPSTAAIAVATAIIAALTGYFLGQGASLGLFGDTPRKSSRAHRSQKSDDSSSGEFSDGSTEGQGLSSFSDSREEFKLVLVARTDLGMTKGKIAAQCSHATLACYKSLLKSSPQTLARWERYGQAKVVLQAKSEEELETLQAQAVSLGLCARIIHDAGRTQIASGSATVLGVGPGPKSTIDIVTGALKLL